MSSGRPAKVHRTLAFRLTVWYAAVFTLSSALAFGIFYLLITADIRKGVDRELHTQAQRFVGLNRLRGLAAVQRAAVMEAQAAGEKKIFFRLLYPDGQVFSSSNMSYWRHIPISQPAIERLLSGEVRVFETASVTGHRHRVRILYEPISSRVILQHGQSLETHTRLVDAFWRIFATTMAALMILAALIGWFMGRRAMAGVAAVTRTARRISEGALDQRVPVKPRGDEIDQLAATFNHMLDRLELLLKSTREMSDNIAHDLRSPITRIRGTAEVTLTTAADRQEYENMAASTVEECDKLLDMINTMLTIAQTEAGTKTIQRSAVDMSCVISEACALFQPPAEDRSLGLVCRPGDGLVVDGDERLLQRVAANLLDNAIKYTPEGGRVTVTGSRNGDQVLLRIADTGCGIAAGDLPHIFDRFYRCDQSRAQPGVGLGLSLARAVARAHAGTLTGSSPPGAGSSFVLTLPAGERPAGQASPQDPKNCA